MLGTDTERGLLRSARSSSTVAASYFGPGRYVQLARPDGPEPRFGDAWLVVAAGRVFAVTPRNEATRRAALERDTHPFVFNEWRVERYYREQEMVGIDSVDGPGYFVYAHRDARFVPRHSEPDEHDWQAALKRWRETLEAQRGTAEERVVKALRIYAEAARAETCPEGVLVTVRLIEIAAFTNLSREMISKTLTSLAEAGKLSRDKPSRVLMSWALVFGE